MPTYCEVRPAAALRDRVQSYWFLTGQGPDGTDEPILPDGRPELVFHLAEPFLRVRHGAPPVRQSRALLAGQIDRPLELTPSGEADVVGIRFKPHGAFAFLGCPLDDMVNETPALDDLDRPLRQRIEAALLAAGPASGRRAAALDAVLLPLGVRRRGDARVAAAVERLDRSRGTIAIAALARAAGWSERQLERTFRREVGLSPKRFARIVRFQAVLRARTSGAAPSWVALAQDLGFTDQAHLVRDFRQFAGAAPARWFGAPHPFTELFFPRDGMSGFDKTGAAPAP